MFQDSPERAIIMEIRRVPAAGRRYGRECSLKMKQIIMLGDSIRMQVQHAVGEKLAGFAEVSGPEETAGGAGIP